MNANEHALFAVARGILGEGSSELDLRSGGSSPTSAQSNRSPLLVLADEKSLPDASRLMLIRSTIPTLTFLCGLSKPSAQQLRVPLVTIGGGDSGLYLASNDSALLEDFIEGIGAYERMMETVHGNPAGYEAPVQAWLRRTVQPGWTCFDVGAHIGIITSTLARKVGPTGHVYSFDAFFQNAYDVALNARNSGVSSVVTATWCAVTDGSAPEVTLYSGRNTWSAEWNLRGVTVDGFASDTSVVVPAKSLDTMHPTTNVDFIKIDVEGAGWGVVQGMHGILQRCSPTIFMEYHGEDELFAVQHLRKAGYSLRGLDTAEEFDDGRIPYHLYGTRSVL